MLTNACRSSRASLLSLPVASSSHARCRAAMTDSRCYSTVKVPIQANSKDAFYSTTAPNFFSKNLEVHEEKGVLACSHVHSVTIFKDLAAAIWGMIGGETQEYSELLATCTKKATEKLVEEAKEMGANGIVNVRFETTTTMNRLIVGLHTCVTVYGTAVVVRSKQHMQ